MTRVLLVLLLSAIGAQCVPSCPSSCVVCSDKALICHTLTEIIDAPNTTEALLLTEGYISNVQSSSLSDLSNVTLIGLSHNRISELGKESFRNLMSLTTLLLDHNLLTSETLQGGVLMNLAHLEVLALGHNRIRMIQADFLKGTEALRTLQLEGNLLVSVDLKSFPLQGMMHLENLDLSDNLINKINKNSFNGLSGLRLLDLSRNRLTSTPPETFSYLSGLTNLNLELNMWNCTCHLLELADFLLTFIQQPNKTLHNGRELVCVSADNPALTTVLELTEANCVPPNQNITVRIESRNSVTPQLYARDVAIAAVICYIGGVGTTLLVVLIWYQTSRRRKLKETRQKEKDEEEIGYVDKKKRDDSKGEARIPEVSGQRWIREGDRNHPRCSSCGAEGTGMNLIDSRRNEGEAKHDPEGRRVFREEGRRKLDLHNHVFSNGKLSSYTGPGSMALVQANNEMVYRADLLQCDGCHQTYRSPEGVRAGIPLQHRPNAKKRIEGSNQDLRRYVSFDLESLKMLEKEAQDSEKRKSKSTRENDMEIETKSKSARPLKVKLNLSPLRKTKVHPKKKSEKSDKLVKSPKKSKDKRKGSKEKRKAEDKKVKKSSNKEKPKHDEKTKSSSGGIEESNTSVDIAQTSPQMQVSTTDPGQVRHGPVHQQQGVGLVLGNVPGFSQTSSSLSAFDRSSATNLSLMRSPTSQLTDSNISLLGGNFLLQNMATHAPQSVSSLLPGALSNITAPSLILGSQANALIPSPANPVASSLTTSFLPGLLNNMGQLSGSPGGPTTSFASGPVGPAKVSGLLPGVSPSPSVSVNVSSVQGSQSQTNILSTSQDSGGAPNTAGKTPPTQTVPQSPLKNPDQTEVLKNEDDCLTEEVLREDIVEPSVTREQTPATLTAQVTTFGLSSSNLEESANTTGTLTATPIAGGIMGADVPGTVVPEANINSQDVIVDPALLQQEYISEEGAASPGRKLRLVLPEKTSGRPPTALEKKIR